MKETQDELTSAFLDGELDENAQDRLLDELIGEEGESLDRLGRYRLIGDVMRGDSSVLANGLVGRVQQALADEPTILAPPKQTGARWLRPVAGVAVAASVAVMAVLVAPAIMTGDKPSAGQQVAGTPPPAQAMATLAALPAASPAAVERTVEAPTAQRQDGNAAFANRLNRLVVEHNEFGGHSGVHGPVPHIGFVSYEMR